METKKFIKSKNKGNECSLAYIPNGTSIKCSSNISKKCAIGFAALLLMFLSSCVLQDYLPVPQNYTKEENTTVVPTNTTPVNTTPVVEPPKQILLPVNDKLAIYILDNEKKGSYIFMLNKKSMLVNVAGDADGLRTLKILRNLGIAKLDYFILTNDYDDNIKGASQIIIRETPKQIIHSGIPSSSSYYRQYTSLNVNFSVLPTDNFFVFDDAVVYLIVPYDDGNAMTNDNSAIVKVEYGNSRFLFATDCGIDCETRISDASLDSDVVVSNGGCDTLSLLFLQQTNPDIVVFSGKPCQETLDRATSLAIPVLHTDTDGDVLITSNGVSYEYTSSKTK